MRTISFAILLAACTPLQRSEGKQEADFVCVQMALGIIAATSDPVSKQAASKAIDFCAQRAEHNTATEALLRASGGRPPMHTDDGFGVLEGIAGQPGVAGGPDLSSPWFSLNSKELDPWQR